MSSNVRDSYRITSPLQRRSRRVLTRIPVQLAIDSEPPVPAFTADISREGGLILSPIAVRPHKIIWVQNQHTQRWGKARVVRVYSPGLLNYYEIGIEFVGEGTSCWQEAYEELLTPSSARKKRTPVAQSPAGDAGSETVEARRDDPAVRHA